MKRYLFFVWLAFCLIAGLTVPRLVGAEAGQGGKIRVLVVTGGHDFERDAFFKLFKDNPELECQFVEHPKAHEMLKPEAAKSYDVVVLYDMWSKISEEAKQDFVNVIKGGKGLVALHHCLASYQDWDEYANIIGGKYHLQKETKNGVEFPASTYKHDVDFTVQVAAQRHPVIRGLKDFKIHDETYGQFEVKKGVRPLLTTTEATSSPTIGWAKTYGPARVVYIALGHDHQAYENPNYQQLIKQAIEWTARKRPTS